MFDAWEASKYLSQEIYEVDLKRIEDQLYKCGNFPDLINVGSTMRMIQASHPHNMPIGSDPLDDLFYHHPGPSLANITEITGPHAIGKTLYWYI
jgi:hypothetical protein